MWKQQFVQNSSRNHNFDQIDGLIIFHSFQIANLMINEEFSKWILAIHQFHLDSKRSISTWWFAFSAFLLFAHSCYMDIFMNKTFDFEGNKLSTIPSEISRLEKLTILNIFSRTEQTIPLNDDFQFNSITSVPSELFLLTELTWFLTCNSKHLLMWIVLCFVCLSMKIFYPIFPRKSVNLPDSHIFVQ